MVGIKKTNGFTNGKNSHFAKSDEKPKKRSFDDEGEAVEEPEEDETEGDDDGRPVQMMPQDSDQDKLAAEGDFAKFNLSDSIVKKLKERKINFLYPIQVSTFEMIREGHDVIAQSRTGTGKTVSQRYNLTSN